MDPLIKQLRELPQRIAALNRTVLIAGALVLAASVGATALFATSGVDRWQYAYTNLAAEDSAEVAASLKSAGVPFRLEAGGAALAVPAEKVYDVRLLLAAAGLPRGGGAGFELFDRGDLGISEFTQKVNLRRALEGELARTIGHLANVRSARVHLTLAEKGLYRDDEHKPAAAVVLALQPGRSVGEREISGIRHLVASSVPGLAAEGVTIVDGRGTVLSAESMWGEAEAFRQRELERSLEARLVTLLELVVGPGAVVARVSASLDNSEVTTSKEVVDPQTALRTEHKTSQSASSDAQTGSGPAMGIAGAAGNQPPAVAPLPTSQGLSRNTTTQQDESRAFDVGRTVTKTTAHGFRLTRLSVALLVDGSNGQPRSDDELQQLAELARKAVGFDPARGDQLEISSAVFSRSTEPEPPPPAPAKWTEKLPGPAWMGPAVLGVIALFGLVLLTRGKRAPAEALPELKAGERVATLEAVLAGGASPALGGPPGAPVKAFELAPDPNLSMRDRARELVGKDPNRAALLLRAWISADEVSHG